MNNRRPKQALGGFGAIVLALATIVLALALTGLIAAFTLNIQGNIDENFCNGTAWYNESNGNCYNQTTWPGNTSHEYHNLQWNASNNFQTGISNISDQAGNIGLVAAAVVVISLLVIGFGGLLARRR